MKKKKKIISLLLIIMMISVSFSNGLYNYTIYIEDNNNLWNNTGIFNITVTFRESTPPSWTDLIYISPLILGNYEIISINVTDPSGVIQVLLEFDNVNHTMIKVEGDKWEYAEWLPTTAMTYIFEIYMYDLYKEEIIVKVLMKL